jgi:hypothetical protein
MAPPVQSDRAPTISGRLTPPDAKSAEAEVVRLFGLTEEQRGRLLILEPG